MPLPPPRFSRCPTLTFRTLKANATVCPPCSNVHTILPCCIPHCTPLSPLQHLFAVALGWHIVLAVAVILIGHHRNAGWAKLILTDAATTVEFHHNVSLVTFNLSVHLVLPIAHYTADPSQDGRLGGFQNAHNEARQQRVGVSNIPKGWIVHVHSCDLHSTIFIINPVNIKASRDWKGTRPT